MRVLPFIAVCVMLAVIFWRPESRAVPMCLALTLLILIVVNLTGCAPSAPTERFEPSQCRFADTGEWRTRTQRGACIARTPQHTVSGHITGGQCIAWAQDTIHERREAVACSKERWVRR